MVYRSPRRRIIVRGRPRRSKKSPYAITLHCKGDDHPATAEIRHSPRSERRLASLRRAQTEEAMEVSTTSLAGIPNCGDGIAQDIIADLSCFRSLVVFARHFSFRFRDKAVDLGCIGHEQGVQCVRDERQRLPIREPVVRNRCSRDRLVAPCDRLTRRRIRFLESRSA